MEKITAFMNWLQENRWRPSIKIGTWERTFSHKEPELIDTDTLFNHFLKAYPPSPVEGEKEKPREREFRITKNYEDGTSEVTCLRINGEKWVKESEQASRIKALEDTEYLLLGQACEYRLKIKALEERLEAADEVIKLGNDAIINDPPLTDYLEAFHDYEKLKH